MRLAGESFSPAAGVAEGLRRFQSETPPLSRGLLLACFLLCLLNLLTPPPPSPVLAAPFETRTPAAPAWVDALSYSAVLRATRREEEGGYLVAWLSALRRAPWSLVTSAVSPEKGLLSFLIVAYLGYPVLTRDEASDAGAAARWALLVAGVNVCGGLVVGAWLSLFPLGAKGSVVESWSGLAPLIVALAASRGEEAEGGELPLLPFGVPPRFRSLALAFLFGLAGAGSVELLVAVGVGWVWSGVRGSRSELREMVLPVPRRREQPAPVERDEAVSAEEKRRLIQAATDKRLQQQQAG